jgi:hypothetical protein
MRPECANWKIWTGLEIEGSSEIGETTLFIRELVVTDLEADYSFMNRGGSIKRIWFCKEFVDWPFLRVLSKHFAIVCIEATPKTYENIPKDIRSNFRIYLKVKQELKPGDFICVGPGFMDEAFQIGTGKKVTPEMYQNDIRIQ